VNKDVLPFAIAQGKYAVMRAANQIGMDRSGFSKEDIGSVRKALRIITKGDHTTIEEALSRVQEECGSNQAVQSLLKFAKNSERGFSSMTTVKVAVVGAGHLGSYHAEKFFNIKQSELLFICDPDSEKSQALAQKIQLYGRERL
jgi:glutamyl-tRNA reductase